jgi:hypothetical protein
MANGTSIHNSPRHSSESMRITVKEDPQVQGKKGEGSKGGGVTPLQKNQGPLSPGLEGNIKKVQDPETERPKGSKMPCSYPEPTAEEREADRAKQAHLEGQVTTQKAHLQALDAKGGEPPLTIAAETFKLEGMALAARPELHGDMSALYEHLGITHPYAPESFPGNEAESIRDYATATHSAYQKVIKNLESQTPRDEAAIGLVKTAHTSFKAQVAAFESAGEEAVMNATIKLERTANQVALLPLSREQRENAVTAAKEELAEVTKELKTFKQASNHILVDEHREANLKGSINWKKNSILHNLGVMFRGTTPMAGTQGLMSLGHWGAIRGGMGQFAKDTYGRDATLARGGIEGTSLGMGHDLVNSTRDGVQGVFELGGFFRPPEPISPEETFPSVPPVHVDDHGNVVRLTADDLKNANAETQAQQLAYLGSLVDTTKHAKQLQKAADTLGTGDVKGAFDIVHKEYADKATNFSFGTPRGNWAGKGAFAVANAIKDTAILMGTMPVPDSTPLDKLKTTLLKATISMGGGGLMGFEHARGPLNNQYMDMPTHRLAKHQNPRGIGERLWNGMQTLDYTNQANRIRLFGKGANATIGAWGANAMDRFISAPLEQVMEDPNSSDHEKLVAGVKHVVTEGAKSIVQLQPFFSDIAAGPEAKKTGVKDGALPLSRIDVGVQNMTHPGRKGAARVHPDGTWQNALEKTENVHKGITQTLGQTAAMVPEVAVQVGAAALKGAGSAGMATVKGAVNGLAWVGEKFSNRAVSAARGSREAPAEEGEELADRNRGAQP